ncbi:MAG: glutathione S-transferase family protein [Pseudomonadales bacterium]|nr:glutathione S-transferase family protein [Pseudomonadales bacterium]MBO7007396.1 glutathione S-transferase family protein [Pseudomonadales bacterium]
MGLSTAEYKVVGSLASPFSVKMRAIFRYRRIPHIWYLNRGAMAEATAHVRPPIIPKVRFPDDPEGEWRVDSSPMAYMLEERHTARSIIPDDPVQAVLSHLLEDFGDEWGTKMMFHYRWQDKDQGGDRDRVGWWMSYPGMGPTTDEALAQRTKEFYEWQIPLWPVAGIEPGNVSLIEEMYREILEAFEDVLREQEFLFGSRPSLGDFGLYGQLYQCWLNDASRDVMNERCMRLPGWLAIMDDAGGVEGEWLDPKAPLNKGVQRLLWLAGEVYLPYLDATQRAIEAGDERLVFEGLGLRHEQNPMKYHAKCLDVIREKVASLTTLEQSRLRKKLTGTNAWQYISPLSEDND